MRYLIFITLFFFACQPITESSSITEAEKTDTVPSNLTKKTPDDNLLVELDNKLQSEQKIRFYIPKEYIKDSKQAVIDIMLKTNYILLKKSLEAKYYYLDDGRVLLAVNNFYTEGSCPKYQAHLLEFFDDGSVKDVFNDFYQDISLYSFYDFGDKQVSQLEGDEKTIFAGYLFDLAQDDKLGVQFMFCNENSLENTKELNEGGKVNYRSF